MTAIIVVGVAAAAWVAWNIWAATRDRNDGEDTRVNWRCRRTGHHSWRYPLEARDEKLTIPNQLVCGRKRCDGFKQLVTPADDVPSAYIGDFYSPSGERIRRIQRWRWGTPVAIEGFTVHERWVMPPLSDDPK